MSESIEAVNILAIGYSNEPSADPSRHNKERISINELVTFISE